MSIYEYDREEHIRMEKQESWEDGVREGILRGEEKQLCKMITKKLKKGKNYFSDCGRTGGKRRKEYRR